MYGGPLFHFDPNRLAEMIEARSAVFDQLVSAYNRQVLTVPAGSLEPIKAINRGFVILPQISCLASFRNG